MPTDSCTFFYVCEGRARRLLLEDAAHRQGPCPIICFQQDATNELGVVRRAGSMLLELNRADEDFAEIGVGTLQEEREPGSRGKASEGA